MLALIVFVIAWIATGSFIMALGWTFLLAIIVEFLFN